MQKTGKRWLFAAVLAVLLALVMSLALVAGCADDAQTPTYRPESPSVSNQPPQDGTTPEDYEALENVSYVIGKLASREYYHSENVNTASATTPGFISVTQNVVGSKDYSDGILITSTISTNSSSLAPSKAMQKYYGDRKVIIRGAASTNSADWDGLDTAWSDGAPSETLTEAQYEERYGLWATEFSDFVINEDTVLSASELTKDGENYSVTLNLSVSGENDAAYYYKKQMVTMGELSALPEFDYVRITINFAPDWTVLSYSTEESYLSHKGIITANVVGTSTTTFSYEQSDVDVSAYENYFAKYDEGGTEEQITAQQYLDSAFASMLGGRGLLEMNASIGDISIHGYVRLLGESTQNITDAYLLIEGVQLTYDDGILYITYGGINGKIDLTDGGREISMALIGDSCTVDGNKVTVTGRFSAAGIDIPVTVSMTVSDGVVSLVGIESTTESDGITASISLAPTSHSVMLSEPDKNSAADLTPIAGDIFNFITTGTFSASAQYSSDLQDISVDADMSISGTSEDYQIAADISASIIEYGYETAEDGTVGERVVTGSHYIHVIYKDGVLYASYSLKSMDAENALRVKITTQNLSDVIDQLLPLLELFGVDTDNIQSIIGAIPLSGNFAADNRAASNGSLVAGRDEDGNNTVTLSGLEINGGTLGASLTAAKNNSPVISAPADEENYLDLSFLVNLTNDLSCTIAQVLTGYDFALSVDMNLLQENILADFDITGKIGIGDDGDIVVYIDVVVNAGMAIYYGDANTHFVISGGNVFITKTQTTCFEGDTEVSLETPAVDARAMTMEYFTSDLVNQLYYALNINREPFEELVNTLFSMFESMPAAEEKGDIGQLFGVTATEGSYDIFINLGDILGVEGIAGPLNITIKNIQNGDLSYISEISAETVLTMNLFGFPMEAVNATVNLTNNNPGTPVDVSAADGVVASVISALGYTDEGQFLSDLAQSGYLTTQTADQPAE